MLQRTFAVLAIIILASIPAAADQPASPKPAVCCKVCTKGIACGNSCISAAKQCHKPPGCACQGK